MHFSRIISIVFILTFLTHLEAQRKVEDFIDLDQMAMVDAEIIESISSDNLDFAPAFYKNGLLFINGNSDKKRIKANERIAFRLMFAKGGPGTDFEKAIYFDSIQNKGDYDGPLCYLPKSDELILTRNQENFVESDDRNEKNLGLFFYQKSNDNWKLSGEFPFNDPDYNVCDPSWDKINNSLYFASDMPGGYGGLDLYVSQRLGDGSWSRPMNMGPNVNSKNHDRLPFIHKEHFLFYTSERDQGDGLDLYASVKYQGDWLESIALPGSLNSRHDDLAMIVSEDGKQIYFSSARPGGQGKDDLYSIRLSDPISKLDPDFITIKILKKGTEEAVENASVRFYKFDIDQAEIGLEQEELSSINYSIKPGSIKGSKTLKSNAQGELFINLKADDYILQVEKENYRISRKLLDKDMPLASITIYLDSILCKKVFLSAINADNREKIQDVRFSDERTGEKWSVSDGIAELCVSKERPMDIQSSAEGYQDFSLLLEYESINDGESIAVSLRPEKIFTEELPVFSGEYTVLENILYDFDQAKLNDDAKKELDKLVEHLLQYPSISIELSAHTDSRGGEVYNQLLSEKRAQNARQYLIAKGIEEWRIAATGYGESRLRNKCSDGVECKEEDHAENRRTEVKVLASEH